MMARNSAGEWTGKVFPEVEKVAVTGQDDGVGRSRERDEVVVARIRRTDRRPAGGVVALRCSRA
jgi:hypothetical protein